MPRITDQEKIANFRRVILFKSPQGIYSHLICFGSKWKGKVYVKECSFRNVSHIYNNRKIFKNDRAGSFGTVPGPILRE